MAKDETIPLRLEADFKTEIEAYTREHNYENTSVLIREAVREKIYPELRKKRLKKDLKELLLDPEVREWVGLT